MYHIKQFEIISIITGHDCRDYIGKIGNGPKNVYRSYKIRVFTGSIYFPKITKFEQSIIHYINKPQYIVHL